MLSEMSPLPRQGWLFLIEFFKMVFLEILASANYAGFRSDSTYLSIHTHVYPFIFLLTSYLCIIVIANSLQSTVGVNKKFT